MRSLKCLLGWHCLHEGKEAEIIHSDKIAYSGIQYRCCRCPHVAIYTVGHYVAGVFRPYEYSREAA